MKLSRRWRVALALTVLVQLWLVWRCAQAAGLAAGDRELFWWVDAVGSIAWLWLAYGNARAVVRGRLR
jgi:hypothetical protein